MNQFSTNILKSVCLIIFFVSTSFCKVSAQTNSRIAVTATGGKTNIWVSDFPKNSTVLLVDADKNILSIVSTNDFGTAFLSLNKAIKTAIVARTMNGDIYVSNEPITKESKKDVETAAVATNTINTKA
jgi:hypothetical protein